MQDHFNTWRIILTEQKKYVQKNYWSMMLINMIGLRFATPELNEFKTFIYMFLP